MNKIQLSKKVAPPSNGAPPLETSFLEEPEEGGINVGYWLTLVRRKLLVIGLVAIASSGFSGYRASQQTPSYQGRFSLLVQPITQKQQLSTLTQDKAEAPKEFDYSTQIEVLLSTRTIKPIAGQVKKRFPDITEEEITGKLSVSRLGETKILEVQYSGDNREKVRFVLEQLASGYLKYSLEEQKNTLRQGIRFIDEQLPTIQKEVASLQQQIQDIRQNYNFIDPDSHAEELSQQLGAVGEQRQTLTVEMANLNARYRSLTQQLGVTSALSQAEGYQDSLKQFEALNRQIAIESARFGENSPTIRMLRQQQRNLAPQLQKEAERAIRNQMAILLNQMQVLKARDRLLSQIEKKLTQKYEQMPIISREFTDLERELKAATNSLSRFLDTRESLEIQAAQNEVPWQLIAPPREPERKAAASLYRNLLTGGMGGVVMGIVLAFLLERIQNTFFSAADLKKKVKLPILGVIPYQASLESTQFAIQEAEWRSLDSAEMQFLLADTIETKVQLNEPVEQPAPEATTIPTVQPTSELPLDDSNTSSFLESFRSLYAAITRLTPAIRSVVISSALPSEGRTTVAIHLAHAAAAMGQRVLLVDGHLRSGNVPLHTVLNLPEGPGLSHLLRGEASLQEVIRRIDWESSLYVISGGDSLPDPTRLLTSTTMQNLVQALHPSFDLVIYDAPPVMGLADVGLIATYCSGVLLVTGLGKWQGAAALTQTLERLKTEKISVLGIVANGMRNYTVNLYGN